MHMSIDIESLGTRPGSVIRSIGACLFNPASSDQQNQGLPVFYANISHRACIEAGLTVDEGTVAWWRTQPRATVAALLPNQLPLREVLVSFVQFWKETQAVHPWGYGANFGMVLIEEAIRRLNEKAVLQAKDDPLGDDVELIEIPWKYSNIRCARTLLALAAVDMKTFPRTGTAHHALDDARTQVNAISLAWRRLRRPATEAVTLPAIGSIMPRNLAQPLQPAGVTSDRPAGLDGRHPFSLKPADDDDGPGPVMGDERTQALVSGGVAYVDPAFGPDESQETRRQPDALDEIDPPPPENEILPARVARSSGKTFTDGAGISRGWGAGPVQEDDPRN